MRSLVVIFAITIGLGGGIFISGMMNGMVDQQTDNAIKNEIANVQIHNPKFLDNMNPKFIIKKVDEKVELIDILEFVTGVCCRTKATGIASTATTETGVTLNGIMPEKEKAVTDIYQKLVQGHYFDKELNTAPILIGEKLSHKLKAGLGKKIVTTVQALNGEMSYALFRVTRIYKTNNFHFDEMNVFVLSADLNPILGIESGEANEIAIKTIDLDASFGVVDKLKLIFPELSIQS